MAGLTLNHSGLAKGFVHTVYPVLLASADFNDWWVVADRDSTSVEPVIGTDVILNL